MDKEQASGELENWYRTPGDLEPEAISLMDALKNSVERSQNERSDAPETHKSRAA